VKFFVYGMLKSDQPKSWMIPFARSRPHTLDGYRMYEREDGKAAMKLGGKGDYVEGEVREVEWVYTPIIGGILRKMLLYFLDCNEGVYLNIYKRRELMAFYTYLYQGDTDGCKVIHKWTYKEARY
jgi:gamma-glutamylcyclotransferase (GGCT)/AIG2-like uncharacterized protein YtfP